MLIKFLKGSACALPFIFALTVCYLHPAIASSNPPALQGDLRNDWYNLGHYNTDGISEITNDGFFIAPDGRTNPQAEYHAFASLLQQYLAKPTNNDLETICRYPARITAIRKHTNLFQKSQRPVCEAYQTARKPDQIESISLIFASGYFDNPSSYYGHTLIRFNYGDDVTNQKTIDASLNYGADFGEQTNPVLYILNGIFGGYTASYRANNDFIHSHRYTNGQLRDLWEYKLNLTPEQIRFVSEHSWELAHAQFDYYFFNDNCAHRIINVVERATGQDLTQSHGFWLMPLQVVQELRDTDDGALLNSEHYAPSLKSVFTAQYEALSSAEQADFIAFLKMDINEQKQATQNYSSALLLLLLDHYNIKLAQLSIKKRDNEQNRQDINAHRRLILFALLTRPQEQTKPFSVDMTPDKSLLDLPDISLARIGLVNRDGRNVINARYQVANNDLLSQRHPGQERSRFIMGAIEADIALSENSSANANDIDLRELVVFDIANLNTNPLPMSTTREYSWGLKLGYSQRNEICTHCGSIALDAKIGKAYRFNDTVMAYSLNGARLNHKKSDDYGYAYFVSENGIELDISDIRADVSLDASYDPIENQDDYMVGIEIAKDLSHNMDLRLNAVNGFDTGNTFAVKIGYHFN